MLDVGRNFVSLDVLKEQLEIMAQYELLIVRIISLCKIFKQHTVRAYA